MKKVKAKALSQTNRYLKSSRVAKSMRIRSIASSTAIETRESVHVVEKKLRNPPPRRAKLA